MAGVGFVFVREDASEVETLAEAFDTAGYFITDDTMDDEDALSVVVWSRHALRSHAFQDAAERALQSGRAVVASLSASPPSESVFDAPVVDLTRWDGQDATALDALFEIVDSVVRPRPANVLQLPSGRAYEDAETAEATPLISSEDSERSAHARRAWEAPLPAEMRRDEALVRKPAASRRDYRRAPARAGHARAQAALAFLAVALIGGALAWQFMPTLAPQLRAQFGQTQTLSMASVSLTSASADAAGLPDTAPIEAPALFEVAPQLGVVGREPPSARSTRRTPRPSPTRAAYTPPAPIPDAIVAELNPGQQTINEKPHG